MFYEHIILLTAIKTKMQNTDIQLFYVERDRTCYFSYIAITRNFINTNYAGNMMIVLDDKTKQTDIYFLFFIYFIVLF